MDDYLETVRRGSVDGPAGNRKDVEAEREAFCAN